MPNGSSSIVQKLWNYCNVLRDDGMSYGDYVEQLTYLLFLKMSDERSKPPYNQPSQIPAKYDWQSLLKKDGDDLFDHYRHILEELGKKGGLLGLIFNKAQNAQGVKANVLFFDKKPASEKPWTKKLWIYDFRTNKDFTLKTNPLKRSDLDEFLKCYNPENRHNRKRTWSEKNPHGRWRAFDYEELINRDKASLDIFWLKDESLEDSENLPDPDIIAHEIVEDLQAALVQFQSIAEDLGEEK